MWSRSQENGKNKVGPIIWDTLYYESTKTLKLSKNMWNCDACLQRSNWWDPKSHLSVMIFATSGLLWTLKVREVPLVRCPPRPPVKQTHLHFLRPGTLIVSRRLPPAETQLSALDWSRDRGSIWYLHRNWRFGTRPGTSSFSRDAATHFTHFALARNKYNCTTHNNTIQHWINIDRRYLTI